MKLMLVPLLFLGCANLPAVDHEGARRACYAAAEETMSRRAETLCPLEQPFDECPEKERLADEFTTALEVCDADVD